jgi:ethanolamine ammonia-lyase large subunit
MSASRLRQLFVLANSFKEGDLRVGGTTDDRVRGDARRELAAMTLGEIRRTPIVEDGVTAALERARDRRFDSELDRMTLDRMKRHVLGAGGADWVMCHRDGLASEAIAGLAKILTNDELSSIARTLFNQLRGDEVAIGSARHFGSRIQPNSPGDDELEILFSIFEGLTYGCGDVILGLNPAADELETIVRLERLLEVLVERLQLPTRYCVLSDIRKQRAAQAHTRVDVGFQSLAGTSRALAGMVGLDVDGLVEYARAFDGLYFETGQGSAVTNGADEGVDMVTLESRAYGLARHLQRSCSSGPAPRWTIVNDVAGFIGPEVFRTAEQLERACLEDVVMAKLHGLTMGLDVCATFHMGIAPASLRQLTARIVERGAPAYLMAVAGNADPMLGYLTTSFREHPLLGRAVGRTVATPMQRRLVELGALAANGAPRPGVDSVARVYAAWCAAGGDRRTASTLEDEGRRRVGELRERGFDLGGAPPTTADARVDALYAHARTALYAQLDDAILHEVTSDPVFVRTAASDRDDYLARPGSGERFDDEVIRTLASIPRSRAPRIQVVVSDGLNALAVNEQLRALLPPMRRALAARGLRMSEHDIVVRHGRVRAGYVIGGLVDADVVVHLIGERPGTGLNTVSAYLTYGNDAGGRRRWRAELDHAATTAICGIHPRGKPAQAAVAEIVRTIQRIVEQRASGVDLRAAAQQDGR